jgi:hypothetical protein
MTYRLSTGKALDRKVGTLRRRLNFLDQRIENYQGSGSSHDKAEASALRFAIEVILTHREEAKEMLTKSRYGLD